MGRIGSKVWRWFADQVANSLQDPVVARELDRVIERRATEIVEECPRQPACRPQIANTAAREYADLASCRQSAALARGNSVFITARFRSGSTMLWNMLRRTPGVTAYYEPLHPTLQAAASQRVPAADPTHVGVDDYWAEYACIDHLDQRYTRPWHSRDLYMDQADCDPALNRYLNVLIRSAPGLPVFQFNRVDFRLGWLRHNYPTSKIIHLFRHPRDQWLSALKGPFRFSSSDQPSLFIAHDYFFLFDWVEDLSTRLPILDWSLVSHPYQMFYVLWKLSYLWGKSYSNLSISYEQILKAPVQAMSAVLEAMGIDSCHATRIGQQVRPAAAGKWRRYADPAWFEEHEAAAEELLASFLGPANEQVDARIDLGAVA